MIRLTPQARRRIEESIEAEREVGSSQHAEALQMLLNMHDQEFGWVIERGDSQPSAPTYWSGPDRWSQSHMDAVRFVRKQDAESVASRLGQGYHRVAEHSWGP